MVEIAATESADLDLFLGIDANGDGIASENEQQRRCATGAALEFCEVLDPDAGTWWLVIQNWEASSDGAVDPITYHHGAVPGSNPGNMSASGPTSVTLGRPFDLEVTWDVAGLEVDHLGYSVITLVDGATDTELATLVFDLAGVPGPAPIYLPDVRDRWPEAAVP